MREPKAEIKKRKGDRARTSGPGHPLSAGRISDAAPTPTTEAALMTAMCLKKSTCAFQCSRPPSINSLRLCSAASFSGSRSNPASLTISFANICSTSLSRSVRGSLPWSLWLSATERPPPPRPPYALLSPSRSGLGPARRPHGCGLSPIFCAEGIFVSARAHYHQ
jgi:hypothetical protein